MAFYELSEKLFTMWPVCLALDVSIKKILPQIWFFIWKAFKMLEYINIYLSGKFIIIYTF